MPVFSLILATVGRTTELNRLFDSLAAQVFVDFEILVVDQNPDERLNEPVARARELGLEVRHLKHFPANLAAARNVGIEAARGEWLGFPDDDCWYDPALLNRLAHRLARQDTPAGLVARWMEQGQPPVTAPTLSWERSSNFRDVPVSSITLFFKRSLLETVGGFDPRLGVGQWYGAAEEHDLVFRALQANAVFAYVPEAEVHHAVAEGPPDATQQGCQSARLRARGAGALYSKHRLPSWVIVRGLVAPVLRPLLKGRFGGELRLGYAVARGRLEGWRGWQASRHHCLQTVSPAEEPPCPNAEPHRQN